MARRTGTAQAPRVEELREVAQDLITLHSTRDQFQAQRVKMLEGRDPIRFPPDAENTQQAHAHILQQQLLMAQGLFGGYPVAKLPADETLPGNERDRLQRIENWLVAVFPLMERQARPVFVPTRKDVLLHGYGMWRLNLDLPRMGRQMPKRGALGADGQPRYPKTADGDTAFMGARRHAIRGMGTATGQFPIRWSHVDARNVYFIESNDSAGLSLVVEVRQRHAREILKNPLYERALPELRADYEKLLAQDPVLAKGAWVQFLVIEDGEWCTYLALHDLATADRARSDPTLRAQEALNASTKAEVALQYPSILGQPQYVLVPGMTSNSPDPGRKYVGITDHLSGLAVDYDFILSALLTEYVNFQAFPPVAVVQDVIRDQFGGERAPGEGEGGEPAKGIDFKPGFHNVTTLRVGQKIQFVRPDGALRDAQAILGVLEENIGRLGFPATMFSLPHGSMRGAGYAMNQALNNVQSKYAEVQDGFKGAWVRTCMMALELAKPVKEPLEVARAGQRPDQVTWAKLDPQKDLDSLAFPLECTFEFIKPQDRAANLQAYHLATDGPNPAMTRNRGRREYLEIDDPENEAELLLVQDYFQDPAVKQWFMAAVLKKAGIKLQQQELAQQGGFSAQDLASIPRPAADTITRMAMPGVPGYEAAQKFQAAHGQHPSVPAPPPAAPAIPGAALHGVAEGQGGGTPGGPHGAGGIGGQR